MLALAALFSNRNNERSMRQGIVVACVVFASIGCLGGGSASEAPVPTPRGDEPFSPASQRIDTGAPSMETGAPSAEAGTTDTAVPATDASIPELPEQEGEDEELPPPPPPVPAGTCADPRSINQIVSCVTDRMPRSGYTMPSATVTAAWRLVVRAMMTGACETIAIPAELGSARVTRFRDSENGRTYCVLREDGTTVRGLGTVIVDPAAEREVVHTAPHPLTDETTEKQALQMFRETRSRAYVMSGVPRRASEVTSTCQSGFMASDAAHEDDHLFHATAAELASFYGTREWTAIQWHGMSATTCPGVNAYLTYGVSGTPASASRLVQLRDAMRAAHPDWKLHTPGSASCSMGGTTNVQGRLLNAVGADKVCGTNSASSSGRFIHIEQQPGYRDANDWIAAFVSVFPATTK